MQSLHCSQNISQNTSKPTCDDLTDVFTKEKRSEVMKKIRSKNTLPEMTFSNFLRKNKIRYKRYPKMFGKPDFLILNEKLVVFIDGCFWHGCPVHYKGPSTNSRFWAKKIKNNIARDRKVDGFLRKHGYKVVRVFECKLKEFDKDPSLFVSKIRIHDA